MIVRTEAVRSGAAAVAGPVDQRHVFLLLGRQRVHRLAAVAPHGAEQRAGAAAVAERPHPRPRSRPSGPPPVPPARSPFLQDVLAGPSAATAMPPAARMLA